MSTCTRYLDLDTLINGGPRADAGGDLWSGLDNFYSCGLPDGHDGPHRQTPLPTPIPLDAPEDVWQAAWECSTFESEHWAKGGSWVDDDDHSQGMSFACGHCGVHSKVLPDGTTMYDGDIF